MKTFYSVISVLTLFFITCGFAVRASAVTRFLDASIGNDASTDCSSANPCLTFNYAFSIAVSGDTISAAPGTYIEASLILSKNLTLKGANAATTIIDSNSVDRSLTVNNGVTASISGLTIQHGRVTGASNGGAINNQGTLTITSCIIKNNIAENFGGGIYNNGTLTLKSSLILANQAPDLGNLQSNQGGGIQSDAQMTITDSTIAFNSAYVGGGISNDGTLSVTNSLIDHNTTGDSGAGLWNDSTFTLNKVTIQSNSATGFGGGIFDGGGNGSMTDVNFISNYSDQSGGGMLAGAPVVMNGGAFYDNSAQFNGGALDNSFGNNTLTNVSFGSNSADVGGAIYNENLISGLTLTNVTFSNNRAGSSGGAIFNVVVGGGLQAFCNVVNTIIANSISGGNCVPAAMIVSLGHNLDSENSCNFNQAGDLTNIDPKLQPPANNGKKGYTDSMALMKGSPAIDHGAKTGCPATDQRGLKRPQDGNKDGKSVCDIGAYEKNPNESF